MTDAEKLRVYESVLHAVQMRAGVTMDTEAMKRLIERICSWSYAHRSGNGELTEDEQDARIERAFRLLAEEVGLDL